MALDGTDVFDDLTEMPAGMAGMRPKKWHFRQNFDGLWGASDLPLLFKFLREFRTDRYMMIPYLRCQVKVQFGVKKVIFTMFGTAGGKYFNKEG